MRGIVVAKMLILVLLGSYLAAGLTQPILNHEPADKARPSKSLLLTASTRHLHQTDDQGVGSFPAACGAAQSTAVAHSHLG